MQRVVVLGRGGAGKSTLARELGDRLGVPAVGLDTVFWSAALEPTPPARWVEVQQELTAGDRWVLDGDLGPYDVLAPRLARADTVVVLDLGLLRCAWRALRRSRERADFWWWVITWRRRSRPALLAAIAAHAPGAELHVLRTPRQVERFVQGI